METRQVRKIEAPRLLKGTPPRFRGPRKLVCTPPENTFRRHLWQNLSRVLCDHSGRGFRGICQLLLLICMARAGSFPWIPAWNRHKECGAYLLREYMKKDITFFTHIAKPALGTPFSFKMFTRFVDPESRWFRIVPPPEMVYLHNVCLIQSFLVQRSAS